MKFRYYITDLFDGVIKGTNEEDVVSSYTHSSDFFVVDTETGRRLMEDGGYQEIEEVVTPDAADKDVGVYFDEDGTMRNRDGSRSIFDDVDE